MARDRSLVKRCRHLIVSAEVEGGRAQTTVSPMAFSHISNADSLSLLISSRAFKTRLRPPSQNPVFSDGSLNEFLAE